MSSTGTGFRPARSSLSIDFPAYDHPFGWWLILAGALAVLGALISLTRAAFPRDE